MVKFVLRISKILGADIATLSDGARVICDANKSEMGLSFIKLLEKGITFYMNLGFKPDINSPFQFKKFITESSMYESLDTILSKIRQIKITDLKKSYLELLDLIMDVTRTCDYDNVNIKLLGFAGYDPPNYRYPENVRTSIDALFVECRQMLEILNMNDETYMYKLLINAFNDNKKCGDEYVVLMDYLVYNMTYSIEYKDKSIEREHLKLFPLLELLKNRNYVYRFKNKDPS